MTTDPVAAFADAERRLMAHYGVAYETRRVRLADPAVEVRVLEAGAGEPLVFVHGSGMCAPTWAPVLAHLPHRRCLAVDLPGFGLSDPYDYSGRSLRAHGVAQMRSLLDALELPSAPVAGTSLGALWSLSLALDAPGRARAVAAIGMPATALPGMKPDPFFRAMTTPVLRALAMRMPPPSSAKQARRAMRTVMGRAAIDRTPDAFFDVVVAGMRTPGWKKAMSSHLHLAFRNGRTIPGIAFTDDELRRIDVPVQFVWGAEDIYGGPEIGRRAVAVMPDAQLEVLPGNHAPFLDDPKRCAELIERVA
jgi:pimeloyl-ACP methyl ester carboxylesterase